MSLSVNAAEATEVTLERMRWWDIEEVLALEAVLYPAQPWTAGQFWSELARVPASRWYVVARREGAIVGYAGLYAVPPDADVQTVAVAPWTQGQGLGACLVEALIAEAARRGVRRLHLEVRADNEPARRLYERLGFVADGRRRDYYGRGLDAVLMTRRVEAGERDD